jgi:hypothetical protein
VRADDVGLVPAAGAERLDVADLLALFLGVERISSISVTMSPPWSLGRKVLTPTRGSEPSCFLCS